MTMDQHPPTRLPEDLEESFRPFDREDAAPGPDQVADLVRAGNKIGAIYAWSRQTGRGFREATAAVEALAALLAAA